MMDGARETMVSGFDARYRELAQAVRGIAAPLTEEQFWQKPFSFGNSVGHLLLHLTGNLNYYIGAQLAGTGYVRERDREFSETKHLPKADVLRHFDQAVAMVGEALRAESVAGWSLPYTAVGEEDAGNRFNIFLRCATHLHHHVGQLTYLGYALNPQSGATVSSSR